MRKTSKVIIGVAILFQFISLVVALIYQDATIQQYLSRTALNVIFMISALTGLVLSIIERSRKQDYDQAVNTLNSTRSYYGPIALILFLTFIFVFWFYIIPRIA